MNEVSSFKFQNLSYVISEQNVDWHSDRTVKKTWWVKTKFSEAVHTPETANYACLFQSRNTGHIDCYHHNLVSSSEKERNIYQTLNVKVEL